MKPKSTGDEVIEHWYTLVSGHQFSSKEFYDHIEAEIAAQKVPALQISRVDLSEGGMLSDRREYLRMQRERLRFDVCAAPVGVNYFFSYRFYAMPAVVQPWEMAVFFLTLGAALNVSMRVIGMFMGPFLLVALLGFLVWLMRNAIGMGLRDVDATLLKIPVIAPIYERYFRKDTYYRQDMRLAYGLIVSAIVKQRVEVITAAKGVQLLKQYSSSPILDGLYHVKETVLQAETASASA